MRNLKQKILAGEIRMYFISENRLAIYGETHEVKNELQSIGVEWNSEKKRLELDEENFKKLDKDIIKKVLDIREKKRNRSLEHISQLLLSGEIKAFMTKDESYQIYGSLKSITRELNNVGFKFNGKNYAITKEEFERVFSNEVKEVVNEYNKPFERKEKETYKEEIYEEIQEEVEY